MKIGFIGTGTMGQPMLSNLLKKGHSVVAYDIVERMYPGLGRIELFARRPRTGWDRWGHEA